MNRPSLRKTGSRLIIVFFTLLLFIHNDLTANVNPTATFEQSVKDIDCYKYVEVSVKPKQLSSTNPFTQVSLSGKFGLKGGPAVQVNGFCDSEDGSIYRIRFMPTKPGDYEYTVNIYGPGLDMKKTGTFTAQKGKSKGIVRVDKEYPWHFIRDGTGEHFFWNSTTTYWLLGWRDESIIRESLDRLARLQINRIRVALSARTYGGMRWKEPLALPSRQFQYRLEPWPAARPENIENPGYDVTRFNLEHFRKAERMLRYARDRDIIVSLIFHLDGRDKGVDPFGKEAMGGEDEQRYYRYCIARFGAFPNIMWDITNEWHLFRTEEWVNKMGTLIKKWDPYNHTTSVHGTGYFPFRKSSWCDYAMYQSWDEHGSYQFMLDNRTKQEETAGPMPQVNEEYGYEDHYPFPWGEKRKWPLRIAESRRKLAWEITMAGCYQTTGERANILGYGGWITGRGNDQMIMLEGYRRMKEFFEKLPWWRLNPRKDLVSGSALCLAEEGSLYVIYLPQGGQTTISLDSETYNVTRFNPRDGSTVKIDKKAQGSWTSPLMPDTEDWVILLKSEKRSSAKSAGIHGIDFTKVPYPRIAMLWSPIRNDRSLESYSRHDLIMAGSGSLRLRYNREPKGLADGFTVESVNAARERIASIKEYNPDSVIIADLLFYEYPDDWLPENHPWWLRINGQRRQFWPGTHRMDWHNTEYQNHIIAQTKAIKEIGVDGVFYDNLRDELDAWVPFLQRLRKAVGNEFLILANAGYAISEYDFAAPYLNGIMYESGWSHNRTEWDDCINKMQHTQKLLRHPKISIIERFEEIRSHAGWPGDPKRGQKPPEDIQARRWSLCYALIIGDFYYLFSDNTSHRHDWYPEYDEKIGLPLEPGQRINSHVWTRKYEGALVVVNLPGAGESFTLTCEKASRDAFTGRSAKRFTIPQGDGCILLPLSQEQ